MSKNQFKESTALLKHIGRDTGRQAKKSGDLAFTKLQASETTTKYEKRVEYVPKLHEANMR